MRRVIHLICGSWEELTRVFPHFKIANLARKGSGECSGSDGLLWNTSSEIRGRNIFK